jgi:hypothetical protein
MIVQVAAQSKYQVTAIETNQEFLDKGMVWIVFYFIEMDDLVKIKKFGGN